MGQKTRSHIHDAAFTTKGSLGTDLGLWISARIPGKHGGSIHLRSCDTPGSIGTAFTLISPGSRERKDLLLRHIAHASAEKAFKDTAG